MTKTAMPASFEAFYAESRDPVFRAVVLATRQPDRAEDAVADAFAAAFARWARLAHHPNARAWVVRTALNAFRSGWRVWRREIAHVPDVVAAAPQPSELEPELVSHLWRLPARQREVVALRILADLDTQQTAKALGIAPGTVTAHLHRALQALRLALRGTDYEELAR